MEEKSSIRLLNSCLKHLIHIYLPSQPHCCMESPRTLSSRWKVQRPTVSHLKPQRIEKESKWRYKREENIERHKNFLIFFSPSEHYWWSLTTTWSSITIYWDGFSLLLLFFLLDVYQTHLQVTQGKVLLSLSMWPKSLLDNLHILLYR